MSTQTAHAKEAEVAADRFRAFNDQLIDLGKKAGLQLVEAYEANSKTYADYQNKVADVFPVEWVATAARAQANFTREITRVYASTTRDLLK
jgi:hypothetical protein